MRELPTPTRAMPLRGGRQQDRCFGKVCREPPRPVRYIVMFAADASVDISVSYRVGRRRLEARLYPCGLAPTPQGPANATVSVMSRYAYDISRRIAKYATIRRLDITAAGSTTHPRHRRRPPHLDEPLFQAFHYGQERVQGQAQLE